MPALCSEFKPKNEFMFGGSARLNAPVPRDGILHYSHGVRQVRGGLVCA
jgi:hypothetical protein